jgi:uridine kinase
MAIDVTGTDAHLRWPTDGQDRPLIIGMAGGSGSGKTTIAQAVIETVGSDSVALIQHDAYYRDLNHLKLEERTAVNFDHPDSLETDLLVRHLERLRAGEAINRPVYDFSTHTRTDRTVQVVPEHVVIVEGILVLAEPELRRLMDLRIYVDTDADLRLLRRLQRDLVERKRTIESVLEQYMSTVRPMHLQFVEVSKRYADIIVPAGYNPSVVGTVTSLIRDFLTTR